MFATYTVSPCVLWYNEAMSADPIVDDIKSRLDIVDVVGRYVTLRQNGANFKGVCPFHNEKTPSFMVNRERQIYRCFGCGEAGDIFSFVMRQENIDFPTALQLLAAQAGVTLPEKTMGGKKTPPDRAKPVLQGINNVAAKFFHQVLQGHPLGQGARDYLKSRNVSDAAIDHFQLGYAPPKSETLMTLLTKQGHKAPVIRAAGSPERFRNRLMFPFRDLLGNVVAFSGRALGAEQVPKYINTSETELFHKHRYIYGLYEAKKAIAEAKKILLVEGPLDLILAHQAGTQFAVATSGTALTEGHLSLLRRYSDVLYLAFDGDSAGQKAIDRAIRLALPFGFEVSVVVVPEGKDPGDIASNNPAQWLELVASPVPAIEWLFRYYFPTGGKKMTAKERDAAYQALFPYIALLDDSVSQSYMLQRMALLLGLTQDKPVIDAYVEWQSKATVKAAEKRDEQPDDNSTASEADREPVGELARRERTIIGMLLIQPSLLEYRDFHVAEKEFTTESYARLYKLVWDWYNKSTTKSSDEIIRHIANHVPAAAQTALQKLLFDTQTSIADLTPDQLVQEYAILVQSLRQRQRDERIQNFAALIAQAEASNDRARVVELMQQMHETLVKEQQHAEKDS